MHKPRGFVQSWVSFLQPSQSNFSQTFKRYCFHTMTRKKINQSFSQTVYRSSERRQHYGFHDHMNLSYQQAYSLFWQTVSCSSQQEQHTCPQSMSIPFAFLQKNHACLWAYILAKSLFSSSHI